MSIGYRENQVVVGTAARERVDGEDFYTAENIGNFTMSLLLVFFKRSSSRVFILQLAEYIEVFHYNMHTVKENR